jgi:hypothetical protein
VTRSRSHRRRPLDGFRGRLAALAFVALFSCFASGCISEPTMELYGARINYATPQGVGMTMTLKVQNDNSFDIQLRNIRTNVTLAGRYPLPPIVHSPQQWLRSDGATLVQVPVIIPWQLVGPLLSASLGSNSLKYRVVGQADVTATRALEVDYDEYTIDQEGRFSRADLVFAAGRGVLTPPVPTVPSPFQFPWGQQPVR